MNDEPGSEIRDVTDLDTFALLPPCADPRFDHRSCDFWEDEVRGSRSARPSWWQERLIPPPPPRQPPSDNPFAPLPRDADAFNPFASPADVEREPAHNPFAPAPVDDARRVPSDAPTKLRLLDRGRAVFGSYAKVLLDHGVPAAFSQFGPLSAYPRAQQIRELYPRLPASPLPAVITCIASAPTARGQGHARRLIATVVTDLAARGFAAVESYPDLTQRADETPAADPAFWIGCGFDLVIDDERYPVMRRELA